MDPNSEGLTIPTASPSWFATAPNVLDGEQLSVKDFFVCSSV